MCPIAYLVFCVFFYFNVFALSTTTVLWYVSCVARAT
jgi:hypothetical protein